MSDNTPRSLSPTRANDRHALLRLEFESLWRQTTCTDRPLLEAFLCRVHAEDRADLLAGLLPIELDARRQRGETLDEAEYRRRFADYRQVVQAAFAASALGNGDESPRQPNPCSLSAVTVIETGDAEQCTLAEGLSVPGYELLSRLGQGGMGVVFKARHLALGRVVALKMILRREGSPQARRRFFTEAAAVARLQHPNIVQVHDFGTAGDAPYFTLEYCDGGSLADLLAQVVLTPRAAARLLEMLARAVHYAHENGVIHRDLKPSNILLQCGQPLRLPGSSTGSVTMSLNSGTLPEDDPWRAVTPKVSDFGLAKLHGVEQTASEAVLGTPGYMSPEQAQDAGQVGPSADVYSLGAVLYECLTGRPPFKGSSPLATLEKVQKEEPARPRSIQPGVPRDLEIICLHCLHKEPGRRYASPEELADDLARFLAGEPIKARAVGSGERLWRWVRRHRALAGLYALLTLTAGSLFAFGLWFSAHRAEQKAALAEARAEADTAAAKADAADRVARAYRYFGLLNKARERVARPEPGWTWQALDELGQAARLPVAERDLLALREVAASAAGGIDLRLSATVAPKIKGQALAWDPTGRYLAVGDKAHLWYLPCRIVVVDRHNPNNPRVLTVIPGTARSSSNKAAPDYVSALAFSPDGRWLAAGMRSGTLYRWDLRIASPLPRSWSPSRDPIAGLAFSRDGRTVFACAGQKAWRFDLDTGKMTSQARFPTRVSCLAIHPTEGWVAVSAGHLHCLEECSLLPIRPALDIEPGAIAFCPDGRRLAVQTGRSVRLFDLAGGRFDLGLQLLSEPITEDGPVSSLAFHPGGVLLATASRANNHVRLWDTAAGNAVVDLPVHHGRCLISFAPDGRTLAVSLEDCVRLYELGGLREMTLLACGVGPIHSFAVHPSYERLACLRPSPWQGCLELAVWPTGPALGPQSRLTTPDTPPAGSRLAARDRQPLAFAQDRVTFHDQARQALRLWDFTGRHGDRLLPGMPECRGIAASEQGRVWFVSGDRLLAWDGETADAEFHHRFGMMLTGKPELYSVAMRGGTVVTGGRDGVLRIFPADRGELKAAATFHLFDVPIQAVSVKEELGLVAAASDRGDIVVCRLHDAEPIFRVTPHRDRIHSLFWCVHVLASGSEDGKVILWRWDGKELKQLLTLRHDRPVRQVRLMEGGARLLVLLAGERAIRAWRLDLLRQRFETMGLAEGLDCLPDLPQPSVALPARKPSRPAIPGGLLAEYCGDADLVRRILLRRDATVNLTLKDGVPAPGVPASFFSVCWRGTLKPPTPGRHVLGLEGQGWRLWLDGRLVLDGEPWQSGSRRRTTKVDLADREHELRIEYRHAAGQPRLRFFWIPPGKQQEEIVPASVFLSPLPQP